MPDQDPITFSFGENWQAFLEGASEETFQAARKDLEDWVGTAFVRGKRVVDVGSGSGIHSLGLLALGAGELISFDVDPKSVAATRVLWERAGTPSHWRVLEGSVLNRSFLDGLGWESFDLVYAWGVLHHTGALWDAVENVFRMVRPGGLVWLAIYTKRSTYSTELAAKLRYNRASPLLKKVIIWRRIALLAWERLLRGQNPLAWNQKVERGMDVYHNLLDWYGGLPYEVAGEEEVVSYARKRGFVLERIRTGEANTVYLFSRPASVSSAR